MRVFSLGINCFKLMGIIVRALIFKADRFHLPFNVIYLPLSVYLLNDLLHH